MHPAKAGCILLGGRFVLNNCCLPLRKQTAKAESARDMSSYQETGEQLRRGDAVARTAGAAPSNEQLDTALALFNAREFEAAETYYRRYLATHPKHLVALNNAALVAKALGRPEVALVRLRKAVRHHPQSATS